jgi:hypothetical protein
MIYRHLVLPSNFLFLNSASYTSLDRVLWPKNHLHTRKSDFHVAREYWFSLPDAQRNPFYAEERHVNWDLLLVNKQVHDEALAMVQSEAELCIDVDKRFIELLDGQAHRTRSKKRKLYLCDIPIPTTSILPSQMHDAARQACAPGAVSANDTLLDYLSSFRKLTLHISPQLTSADIHRLTPLTAALHDARHSHTHVVLTTTRCYNPYDDTPPPSRRLHGLKRLCNGLHAVMKELGGTSKTTLTLRIIDLRPTTPWALDLDDMMDIFPVKDWEKAIQEVVDFVKEHGNGILAESWCPNRGPRRKLDEFVYGLGHRQQQNFYPRRIGIGGEVLEDVE